MLKPENLPASDDLVDYGDGTLSAVMFHYSPAGIDLEDIAEEHGFEVIFLEMKTDLDEDHPLRIEYEDEEDIVARWDPKASDGCKLGGKFDDEDRGPFAVFIRRREQAMDDAAS
jgi:hypothetical protein